MTDDAEVTHLLAVSEATARSRVKDESREAYNSKIKYCINFMRNVFPQEVELGDDGIERLKLPLSFNALSALFANIMTDTNLSRTAKKRKAEFDARVEEVDRVRQAMINRGITDEGELPAIPVEEEDTTINKARSITAAKTTVGGYKSALKLHYNDRKIQFKCIENAVGSQDIDTYLNEQIKSYGNLQATKKQQGIMPAHEGKCAMTGEGFTRMIRRMILFKPRATRAGPRVLLS
jgi:hypothetical protein